MDETLYERFDGNDAGQYLGTTEQATVERHHGQAGTDLLHAGERTSFYVCIQANEPY